MTAAVIALLVLLVPGMIAMVIYSWLQNRPLSPFSMAVGALIFAFLINLFTFLVMALLGASVAQTADLFLYLSTTTKYAAVALAAGLALPGAVWLLSQIKRGKAQ
jgi:hypothetical protein